MTIPGIGTLEACYSPENQVIKNDIKIYSESLFDLLTRENMLILSKKPFQRLLILKIGYVPFKTHTNKYLST